MCREDTAGRLSEIEQSSPIFFLFLKWSIAPQEFNFETAYRTEKKAERRRSISLSG